MALILLSGSWMLIFLDLTMYGAILGVPMALYFWLRRRSKNRLHRS
jgi:hypothetical protein